LGGRDIALRCHRPRSAGGTRCFLAFGCAALSRRGRRSAPSLPNQDAATGSFIPAFAHRMEEGRGEGIWELKLAKRGMLIEDAREFEMPV